MNAEEITPLRLLAPHSSGPSDEKKGHSAIRTNAHGHIFTDFCELCFVDENAYGMHADKLVCVRVCWRVCTDSYPLISAHFCSVLRTHAKGAS